MLFIRQLFRQISVQLKAKTSFSDAALGLCPVVVTVIPFLVDSLLDNRLLIISGKLEEELSKLLLGELKRIYWRVKVSLIDILPIKVCHNYRNRQSKAQNSTNGTERGHKLSSRCFRCNISIACIIVKVLLDYKTFI